MAAQRTHRMYTSFSTTHFVTKCTKNLPHPLFIIIGTIYFFIKKILTLKFAQFHVSTNVNRHTSITLMNELRPRGEGEARIIIRFLHDVSM